MTKPVTIPNTFATATTAIPLSNLDADFSTVATALNDANTYSNYAPDTGSANAYIVTLSGVSTTYSAGLRIQFKAGNANTTASTLNVNGGGAKNITYQDATAIASGTIAANSIVDVMYDGTQFLLMNDPAGATGGDVVGPSSATDNAIVRFDGTTGKLVQNSVVTIADSTGDISGVGQLNATTLDATNIEVTNIKAKDGTAAASIADSTGVISITSNPILSGGTANGVGYLNASKVLTTGSALTFDGTNLVNLGGVVRALAAATQDALQLQGRAAGTSSYITTLTPGTLTASNTLTLPVGTTTLAGLGTTQTFSAAQTFSSTVTMSGTTTNIDLGTSQTSGTWTAGGTAQTGTITLDRSTKTHTLAIGTGATESGLTKTINIGTGGVATSTTAITIGSTNGTTITLNGTVNATTVNVTTLDLTNLEVTNIKAKDGTAAGSIADSTGVVSFTANPVMSGGTANGVLYLNGSKVATSGSALTFDGTNFQAAGALRSAAATAQAQLISGSNVAGTTSFDLIQSGADAYVYNRANGPLLFGVNNAEAMRLTSTGLGIGTSSPTANLTVAGGTHLRGYTAPNTSFASLVLGITSGEAYIQPYTTGLAQIPLNLEGSTVKINTGGSTRVTVDSSGNLGLGVTPSASTVRALQVSDSTVVGAQGVNLNTTANAYFDSSFKYHTTGVATWYQQSSGQHAWYTAPSGTAGNAITFTQAMTLDASGRLGIGTTSPSQTLNVNGIALFEGSAQGNVIIQKTGTNGFSLFSSAAGTLGFYDQNAGAERARIDSSGNWLVGTTSGSDKLVVEQSAAASASLFVNSSGTATAQCVNAWHKNTTGDNVFLQFFTEASATSRGSITYNRGGGVVAYNTTSDYRLKNVLGSIADSGARIDSLEPIEFEWKSNGLRTRGFLAHRFQEVYPNSVTGNKDAVDDKGEPIYQAMQASTSEIMADLVAEIQSLRQRVALLEGN